MNSITALLTELAAQQQAAVKLFSATAKAFYGFIAFACLTAGVVAFSRGNHQPAAAYGGAGIVLLLIWAAVIAANKGSQHAVRTLRADLGAETATVRRSPAADDAAGDSPIA